MTSSKFLISKHISIQQQSILYSTQTTYV